MSAYYHELQSFRKPVFWIIMSIALLPTIGIMLYGSYKQLVLGEVWGNKPISDITLIIITLIVVILTLAIAWFIFNLELIVEIKNSKFTINSDQYLVRR